MMTNIHFGIAPLLRGRTGNDTLVSDNIYFGYASGYDYDGYYKNMKWAENEVIFLGNHQRKIYCLS